MSVNILIDLNYTYYEINVFYFFIRVVLSLVKNESLKKKSGNLKKQWQEKQDHILVKNKEIFLFKITLRNSSQLHLECEIIFCWRQGMSDVLNFLIFCWQRIHKDLVIAMKNNATQSHVRSSCTYVALTGLSEWLHGLLLKMSGTCHWPWSRIRHLAMSTMCHVHLRAALTWAGMVLLTYSRHESLNLGLLPGPFAHACTQRPMNDIREKESDAQLSTQHCSTQSRPPDSISSRIAGASFRLCS